MCPHSSGFSFIYGSLFWCKNSSFFFYINLIRRNSSQKFPKEWMDCLIGQTDFQHRKDLQRAEHLR